MKKPLFFVALAGLSAALLTTSCETQDAGGTISISPSFVEIRAGQSVTLTASGGIDYTWSTSGSGGLSRTTGQSVVFIAPSSITTTTEQVVTVTSGNSGSTYSPPSTSTTSTNAPSVSVASGSATIRILGSSRTTNASAGSGSSSSSTSNLPPMP